MAKTPATTRTNRKPAATPALETEFAHRLLDPFETNYMGVLRTADPLLIERGESAWRLYRDLMRDGEVYRGYQKRVSALVGSQWRVEPVQKSAKGTKDAQTLTGILKAMRFDQASRDLMQATLCGFAVSEIVWTVRDGWIVPKRLVQRAQRRFVFVQEDEQQPVDLRLLTRENMLTGVPVPPRKFIVHRFNPEDDNPYGMGLGLQLYWAVYFKRKGIVSWNKHNDRFGTPTPWGRYPRGASPKEKDTLFSALKAFSNDGVIMTPEGSLIELLEAAAGGTSIPQHILCGYMDDWIAGVLTGREPRTSGGGALAAASKERRDVSLDITQADSDLESETFNDTMMAWICELNGFEPCQVYRVVKEEEDLKHTAETDKIVSEMGFELDIDSVRSKYGDGWQKKETPAPLAGASVPRVPVPGLPVPGAPASPTPPPPPGRRDVATANFAEAPPVDPVVRQLGQAGAAIVRSWVGRLRPLVEQHDDPGALQDALLAAYGDLDVTQLAEIMELAFTLAQLQEMDRAAQEVGDGDQS